ncbi:hypothetical protein V2J09_019235 [Rumex salicifolius]
MCLVSYYSSKNGTPDLTLPKNQSPSLIFGSGYTFFPKNLQNSEALTAIIEGNFARSFLKMDPNHNNNRMNMFTRFCINTDVGLNVGKRIIIPDENCNPIKYKLWFDDFSDGCGACGLPDHVFKEYPNRAIPIPILRITIKKSTSKFLAEKKSRASSSDCNDWFPKQYTIINTNPILLRNLELISFMNPKTPMRFYVLTRIKIWNWMPSHISSLILHCILTIAHCYNPLMWNIPNLEINVDHDALYEEQGQEKENAIDGNTTAMEQRTTGFEAQINKQDSSFFQDELTNILNQNYILNTTLPVELGLPAYVMDKMCAVNPPMNNPIPHFEIPPPEGYEELEPMNVDSPMDKEGEDYPEQDGQGEEDYYEEEEEEPFEDDDTLLNLENEQEIQDNTPSNPAGAQSQEQIITSEASFHSIHKSRNSSSTMVRKIKEIDLENLEMSTSNSSKRKNNEDMDDTASSVAVGASLSLKQLPIAPRSKTYEEEAAKQLSLRRRKSDGSSLVAAAWSSKFPTVGSTEAG